MDFMWARMAGDAIEPLAALPPRRQGTSDRAVARTSGRPIRRPGRLESGGRVWLNQEAGSGLIRRPGSGLIRRPVWADQEAGSGLIRRPGQRTRAASAGRRPR